VIGESGDRKSNTEAGLTADEGGLGTEEGLPLIHTDDTDRRIEAFNAKDAEDATVGKGLPLIHTDDTDKRSGDRVIGESGDRKSNTEAGLTADEGGLGAFTAKDAERAKEEKLEKGLPRINTDYTDRSDLPRINADERGLEEEEEESKVVTMRM